MKTAWSDVSESTFLTAGGHQGVTLIDSDAGPAGVITGLAAYSLAETKNHLAMEHHSRNSDRLLILLSGVTHVTRDRLDSRTDRQVLETDTRRSDGAECNSPGNL